MNIQYIHLDIQCSNPACKGFNYYEDETGYYICADCSTFSQIRCGQELDYTAPIRSIKSKIVIKGEDDDNNPSDDGIGNENNDFDLMSQKFSFEGDTIMNISTTNVKSSRYEISSYNDFSSVYSRSTKKKNVQIKTTQQILIEIQGYFENIINILINDFFEKKDNNTNDLKNSYFTTIIHFGENEKQIFYGITSRIWIYFIAKKYKVIENPVYKRKELIRSRINSLDEEKEKEFKKNKDNENEEIHNNVIQKTKKGKKNKKNIIKPKEKSLHEQTKMRRITERNVYNIYNPNNILSNYSFGKISKYNKNENKNNFYKENNFNIVSQKKIYLKRFIKEYDQVINFIKKDKCFDIVFETEEEKEKINITNVIEYEQLIRVCEELGINTKNQNTIINKEDEEELNYESLIHLIYKQQFCYYEKNNEDNNQITNGINSNHFLFLIYEIFHYNKIPLLLNDILFNYKNFFYVNKLSLEEINYLYLLNFKKYKAHINWFENNKLDDTGILKKAEAIIDKICNHILKMPDLFSFLCKYILKILHNNEKIKTIILTKYIIEYTCIGIIFYCLKIIYGLNDLPYMCLLLNNINKKYFDYNNDIDLKEEINLYQKNTKNDKLCNIYLSFPSELDIIKILINELKIRNNNSLLIFNTQRKLNYSNEYKKKYIEANLNDLYKKFYDDFTFDINELEKKYNKNNDNNSINNKIKNKKNKKSWKISKTKEFDKKIDNIENPIKIFNPFIKEEISFHESVYKIKDNNVEFPLPFDTYIRMKKHSQKLLLNYHRPSEMIFIYLICEYFKIDYLSLRTLIRLVEYYIEKIYNK